MKESKFLKEQSEIIDYIDVLEKKNKCIVPSILDATINVCKARKKELNSK